MRPFDQLKCLPLAGFPIRSTNAVVLVDLLQKEFVEQKKCVLLFANTNFILKCSELKSWLFSEEILLVNDGIGLDIASFLFNKVTYETNLNGTDFVPFLLSRLKGGCKVFLFGGGVGVAEKAGELLNAMGDVEVVGCLNGYTGNLDSLTCEIINKSKANIVLVAMGNPLQERWIRDNLDRLDAPLFIGVGALLDFLAGNVKRAPIWVQKVRFEWLYRLLQEPRRLGKRYSIDIFKFLFVCWQGRKLKF